MAREKSTDPAAILRAQRERERTQKLSRSLEVLGDAVNARAQLETVELAAQKIKEDRAEKQTLFAKIQELQKEMRDLQEENEALASQCKGLKNIRIPPVSFWKSPAHQVPGTSGNTYPQAPWNHQLNASPSVQGRMDTGMENPGLQRVSEPSVQPTEQLKLPQNCTVQKSHGNSMTFESPAPNSKNVQQEFFYDLPAPGEIAFGEIRTDGCIIKRNSFTPRMSSPKDHNIPISGSSAHQEAPITENPPNSAQGGQIAKESATESHHYDEQLLKTPTLLEAFPWLFTNQGGPAQQLDVAEEDSFSSSVNSDVSAVSSVNPTFEIQEGSSFALPVENQHIPQNRSPSNGPAVPNALHALLQDTDFSLDSF